MGHTFSCGIPRFAESARISLNINPNAGAPVSSEAATQRQKRLAQALRANLRKRKTQTRERAAGPTDPARDDDAQATQMSPQATPPSTGPRGGSGDGGADS